MNYSSYQLEDNFKKELAICLLTEQFPAISYNETQIVWSFCNNNPWNAIAIYQEMLLTNT